MAVAVVLAAAIFVGLNLGLRARLGPPRRGAPWYWLVTGLAVAAPALFTRISGTPLLFWCPGVGAARVR